VMKLTNDSVRIPIDSADVQRLQVMDMKRNWNIDNRTPAGNLQAILQLFATYRSFLS
jgi:hypothetical protein